MSPTDRICASPKLREVAHAEAVSAKFRHASVRHPGARSTEPTPGTQVNLAPHQKGKPSLSRAAMKYGSPTGAEPPARYGRFYPTGCRIAAVVPLQWGRASWHRAREVPPGQPWEAHLRLASTLPVACRARRTLSKNNVVGVPPDG